MTRYSKTRSISISLYGRFEVYAEMEIETRGLPVLILVNSTWPTYWTYEMIEFMWNSIYIGIREAEYDHFLKDDSVINLCDFRIKILEVFHTEEYSEEDLDNSDDALPFDLPKGDPESIKRLQERIYQFISATVYEMIEIHMRE